MGGSSHNCGERDDFAMVSQWFATPYYHPGFDLRIEMMKGNGVVLVLLEAENGKFYTIRKKVRVKIPCGASGVY